MTEIDQKLADPYVDNREWWLELKAKALFQDALKDRNITTLKQAIAHLDQAHDVLCSYFADRKLAVNPYKNLRDFYARTLEGWEGKK